MRFLLILSLFLSSCASNVYTPGLQQILFDGSRHQRSNILYMCVGEQHKPTLYARFVDGRVTPLTDAHLGTIFTITPHAKAHSLQETGTRVVTISKQGIITAHRPGIAMLSVTNGRIQTQQEVYVDACLTQ